MYFILIGLQLVNDVAPILIYAFLCIIHAALTGIISYFAPKLYTILRKRLSSNPELAIRLGLGTLVCFFVFLCQTIGFARRVAAPPKKVYWWWHYGCLEIIPMLLMLTLLKPTSQRGARVEDERRRDSPVTHPRQRTEHLKATGRRAVENDPLLKTGKGYGSATGS